MVRTLDATKASTRATKLRDAFSKQIVGQPRATEALVGLVDKFNSGMYDKSKPIGSMLELGPTGTGKTAVAEALVIGLGGIPERNLMKIDCGEFQHSHEIAKLGGSPPGYLGHRETSPYFTNASLKAACDNQDGSKCMPFTVILWDEIEKASDALWALMLGILDKARFTTGTNEIVDFKNTVHILTSNIGASEMSSEAEIGFLRERHDASDKKLEDIAMNAAKKKFMPEFLNRLDYIVMFKTLDPADLDEILGMQLNLIQDRILLDSKVTFEFNVSPAALRQLVVEGFDRRYNARELKRTIEKHVYLPLSRMVSSCQIDPNDTVIIDYDGGWKYFALPGSQQKIGAAIGTR